MRNLNLNVVESYDLRTLVIQDISDYDGLVPINPIIEVKAPGANCFYPFYTTVGWCSKVLNCDNLHICCVNCPVKLSDLPDGIYEIKYSIDPNVYTVVEFNHFRTSSLSKQLVSVTCDFFGRKCDYKKSEYGAFLDMLTEIKFTLDTAKWKVEECLESQEGLDLYEKAKTLLNDFTTNCPCDSDHTEWSHV